MKAMILAAGKGTRVRPITYLLPKPMIPLLQRPVMEFLVDHLARHGFDQIVVNTSYLAGQIEDYFRDGRRFGVEMAYSFEGHRDGERIVDEPLGSAGGLRRVQDFSGFFDDTFVVLCGDALIDVDLTAAVRFHRARGALATIVMKEVAPEEVSSYGIVVTEPDGRVRSFQEKPAVGEARSTTANTGIYIFEPAIFRHIPAGAVYDIGSQLFPALLAAQAPFYGVNLPFQWVDIGNAADYWSATMKILRGEVSGARIPGREVLPGVFLGLNVAIDLPHTSIRPPVWIGGSTRIERGARLVGPVAIGSGCVVEGDALVECSVVWDYTRVSRHADLRDKIVCGRYCVTHDGDAVDVDEAQLNWVVDDARSRPRRTLDPAFAELFPERPL
jgi:mannose-1-phosphate guanylyltransferase